LPPGGAFTVEQVAGASVPQPLWQTAQAGEAMQVWLADDVPCSTGTWLAQKDGTDRLAAQVRMNTLVRLTEQTMMAALTAASDDMPPADPAMVVYHMTPSGAPVLADSLWQRWLSQHTALNSLPGWQPNPHQRMSRCRILFCRCCHWAPA
jgi:hypothetical protein